MATRYDIIIGLGLGGGTLAYRLAPSRKKILLLGAGGYLPHERDNWSSKTVFIDNEYKADETWLDKYGGTFHPGIHYYVGGNSKVYGAALLRMGARTWGRSNMPSASPPSGRSGSREQRQPVVAQSGITGICRHRPYSRDRAQHR